MSIQSNYSDVDTLNTALESLGVEEAKTLKVPAANDEDADTLIAESLSVASDNSGPDNTERKYLLVGTGWSDVLERNHVFLQQSGADIDDNEWEQISTKMAEFAAETVWKADAVSVLYLNQAIAFCKENFGPSGYSVYRMDDSDNLQMLEEKERRVKMSSTP